MGLLGLQTEKGVIRTTIMPGLFLLVLVVDCRRMPEGMFVFASPMRTIDGTAWRYFGRGLK